jgi:hypothetical protein
MAAPRSVRTDVVLALLALAIGSWAFHDGLRDPAWINNDVRQHVAWMQDFDGAGRFAADPLSHYARAYQPWGWVGLYRALAPVVPPLVLSRYLPLLLLVVLAVLVGRWAHAHGGPAAAVAAGLLLLLSPAVLARTAGALPRAFAFPLLAALLWQLQRRSGPGTAVSLVLAAAFYPPAFLLGALASVLCSVGRGLRLEPHGRGALAGVALGAALLFAEQAADSSPAIGELVTRAEMAGRPEFTADGRYRVLPTPWLPALLLHQAAQGVPRLPFGTERLAAILLLAGLVFGCIRARECLSREWWALVASSAACFFAADLLLLRLFMPSRYVEYAAPLLVAVAGGIVIARLLDRLPPGSPRMLVAALLIATAAARTGELKNSGLTDYGANRDLLAFLASQPVGTLVAAPPRLADEIPTFAGQPVFVNHEHAQPFFREHWRLVEGRTRAFFEAYYAARLADVDAFCRQHGIELFVVDVALYDRAALQRGRAYFAPFGAWLRELTRERERFALEAPAARALFARGPLRVYSCAAFDEPAS